MHIALAVILPVYVEVISSHVKAAKPAMHHRPKSLLAFFCVVMTYSKPTFLNGKLIYFDICCAAKGVLCQQHMVLGDTPTKGYVVLWLAEVNFGSSCHLLPFLP